MIGLLLGIYLVTQQTPPNTFPFRNHREGIEYIRIPVVVRHKLTAILQAVNAHLCVKLDVSCIPTQRVTSWST